MSQPERSPREQATPSGTLFDMPSATPSDSADKTKKVLLVTNDFPPTIGGIQSYLRDFLATLDPSQVIVFASTQDAQAAAALDATLPYPVVRWPHRIMLPTPSVRRRMAELIKQHNIHTVWFGAAAPLGLLAPAARAAGARRIVASTHGHEVGWSMLPGARSALRRIGTHADTVTYISSYTLGRFRRAFGPNATFAHLPSGVSTETFHPVTESQRESLRTHLRIDAHTPLIVCVSRLVPRKGQDKLIEALPKIRRQVPGAELVLVGAGPYEKKLRVKAADTPGVRFAGRVSDADMLAWLQVADVVAMPCRTRGWGLDVEGLGIVFLEGQACGIPVVAGSSGGAPETLTADTGVVVDGRNIAEIASAVAGLLRDPEAVRQMGKRGRQHVLENWTWEIMGARLRRILFGA